MNSMIRSINLFVGPFLGSRSPREKIPSPAIELNPFMEAFRQRLLPETAPSRRRAL